MPVTEIDSAIPAFFRSVGWTYGLRDIGSRIAALTAFHLPDVAQTCANGPEFCIICGAETEFTFEQPIVTRRGYVEGVGQCCDDCA